MEILYLLIPMSVLLVFVIAAIFWWSLKSGQFEDMDGPGYRILMDDDRAVQHPSSIGADSKNAKEPSISSNQLRENSNG